MAAITIDSATPIRVLVADDHAVVREGIKSILAEAPDIFVVGEASDGVEAIAETDRLLPEVVVLDVQMPRGGGLETLRALRRSHPSIAVLMLSFHPEETFAVPFLREGAAGYLAKDRAGEALLDAIRRIRAGHKYVTAPAAEKLARRLVPSSQASPHDGLSAQELIVLSRLASGRSVDEIGEELLLSSRTIQRCCCRIVAKTGLPSQVSAIHYAMHQGIGYPSGAPTMEPGWSGSSHPARRWNPAAGA